MYRGGFRWKSAIYHLKFMLIAHTADLHLKDPATPHGAARFAAFEQACKAAARCDVLIIAGDVFDSAREAAPCRERLRAALSSLGQVPALIIPGNHDRLGGPCPFDDPSFDIGQMRNVRVAPRTPSVALEMRGVHFITLPFEAGQTSAPLVQLCAALPPSAPKVAVMHGSCDAEAANTPFAFSPENIEEGGDFFIYSSDLAKAGITYAALGHIHKASLWRQQQTVASYPGSPCAVRITEHEQRGFNLVSLDEKTGAVTIKHEPLSAGLRAERKSFFCLPGAEEKLGADIEAFFRKAGPASYTGVLIEGAGNAALAKTAVQNAAARAAASLKVPPDVKLMVTSYPEEVEDAMRIFLEKLSSQAQEHPDKADLLAKAAAIGIKAIAEPGRQLSPDDLPEGF